MSSERPKSMIPPIEGSCSAREIFALRALGDSMIPEFAHDTVIIVDPEAVVRDNDYVIAKIEEEFIFRQLKLRDKKFFLQPLNDLYETIEIDNLNVLEGVVIQSGSRRNHLKKYR